jgi:hypothetical protein
MSELFPARTIALEVLVCTDESRMAEFNRWYDKVHIPILRQIRGIVSVHRYREMMLDFGEFTAGWVTPKGQPVRYLTMYRINWPNPWGLMQKIKRDDQRRAERDKMIDCMKTIEVTVWDFYAVRKRIQPLIRPETHLPDGMPEAFLLVSQLPPPQGRREQDDWWLFTHSHDLMEIPGYVQCSRYHSLNPKPADTEPTALNIYEIDSDDPRNLPLMKNFMDDRDIRRPEGRFLSKPASAGPTPQLVTHLRGAFQHWDVMSALF